VQFCVYPAISPNERAKHFAHWEEKRQVKVLDFSEDEILTLEINKFKCGTMTNFTISWSILKL